MEVDLAAIRANAAALAAAVAPARLCAVVKADGYGHGDVPSAEAALEAGASWLAVALVAEGARLREADVDRPHPAPLRARPGRRRRGGALGPDPHRLPPLLPRRPGERWRRPASRCR